MRTKILLCAAALVAAGATAMAQSNVYSLNVVGYVNLSLAPGLNLVANQMDTDGTGTNNTIASVFGSVLPASSQLYKWNSGSGGWDTYSFVKTGRGTGPFATNWSPNATAPINPGMGVMVSIPAGDAAQTVTTVGNVLQGALVNPNLPAGGGLTALSSMVPLSGAISTSLAYNAAASEQVYLYNNTEGGYDTYSFVKTGRGTGPFATNWSPSVPSLNVGQGFVLSAKPGSTWSNNFTVGP